MFKWKLIYLFLTEYRVAARLSSHWSQSRTSLPIPFVHMAVNRERYAHKHYGGIVWILIFIVGLVLPGSSSWYTILGLGNTEYCAEYIPLDYAYSSAGEPLWFHRCDSSSIDTCNVPDGVCCIRAILLAQAKSKNDCRTTFIVLYIVRKPAQGRRLLLRKMKWIRMDNGICMDRK